MNMEVEVQRAEWGTPELGDDRKPGCHLSHLGFMDSTILEAFCPLLSHRAFPETNSSGLSGEAVVSAAVVGFIGHLNQVGMP